ncbi:MAG: hypothetical protein AAGI46_10845 [Planctomycetota bacterium]
MARRLCWSGVLLILVIVSGCGIKPRTERQQLSLSIDRDQRLSKNWVDVWVVGVNDVELAAVLRSDGEAEVLATVNGLIDTLEQQGMVWRADFEAEPEAKKTLPADDPLFAKWAARNAWGVIIYAEWPPDDRDGRVRSVSLDARDWSKLGALADTDSATFRIEPGKIVPAEPKQAPIPTVATN